MLSTALPLAGNSASLLNAEAVTLSAIAEHVGLFLELQEHHRVLAQIADRIAATLKSGGKVLLCGNGGSAADAQHLAAEFVGRYQRTRRGLAAIALTTDSSVLTSIANDFGYGHVFSRQVEALGSRGDLLICLSTSGESENVCRAMLEARRLGLNGVAMVGGAGGRLAGLADVVLSIPSTKTARIQEAHLFCGHILCDLVERALGPEMRDCAIEDQQAGLNFGISEPESLHGPCR